MLSFRFVQTRFAACPVPFGTPLAFTKAQTISSPCHLMWFRAPHFRALAPTPATRIVVEPSPVRGLAADCPLSRRLGSHPAPSVRFFPLSPPSHPGMFHPHVLVRTALGVPSNSACCRMDFHHTLHGNYLSVEGVAYPCDLAPDCDR